MTEDEAKLKYESLYEEVKNLHLEASRKENNAYLALKEWQKICKHEFLKEESVYGYKFSKECIKCKFVSYK